jgi:hypothetical protein
MEMSPSSGETESGGIFSGEPFKKEVLQRITDVCYPAVYLICKVITK